MNNSDYSYFVSSKTPQSGVSSLSERGSDREADVRARASRNKEKEHIAAHSELTQVSFPRGTGILLPIFSLPSRYGIGTFGPEAYRFCDFLQDAGMRYWQILPLGPTSYGDSPYQSFSTVAGNPYFIDLEYLCADGLLEHAELETIPFGEEEKYVNYSLLYNQRYRLLHRAFERAMGKQPLVIGETTAVFGYSFLDGDRGTREALARFREQNADWIEEYALFQALKAEHFAAQWTEWAPEYRDRDATALTAFREQHAEDLLFQVFLQYHFFRQWKALKNYAHEKGLLLIGDMPIYVAHDSPDVWVHRDEFYLDATGNPTVVAGAPPDTFTADGQRWGNPLYRWDVMAKRDYSFWVHRVRANLRLYDVLRLDHFIGFSHYWTVPAEDETARYGHWEPGPGLSLFLALQQELGPLPILVEDLGVLSPEVISLREKTGFPGMKPLQFAFDGGSDSDYLPHHFDRRSSIYTGTHDTPPLRTWWEQLDPPIRAFVEDYFALHEPEGAHWGLLRGAISTVADLCILPMQDILWTDERTRINRPGSLGGNWKWRLLHDDADTKLSKRLRALNALYGR